MNQRYKILLVDDEPGIRESLRSFLERYLFEVFEAATGEEALDVLDEHEVDLILLDMMLPDMHGIEICKRIKNKRKSIPIIFLTGVTDATETVLGFEAGADDYVEKPFNPHVLLARIRTKLKSEKTSGRQTGIDSFGDVNIEDFNQIQFGRWSYYPKKSLVTHPDHPETYLTDKESALLKLLLSDPGKTFSRDDIASYLNLSSHGDVARDVNIHVHRLRTKLTQRHNAASPIKAVRSQGYTLDSYLTYVYDGKELSCL
ncbi:response regulator transcription factor [Thiotrichales bacterium 19X7-9]|nr:response regulator transcription factor [Thiotrichales bacterium 19X7-9]